MDSATSASCDAIDLSQGTVHRYFAAISGLTVFQQDFDTAMQICIYQDPDVERLCFDEPRATRQRTNDRRTSTAPSQLYASELPPSQRKRKRPHHSQTQSNRATSTSDITSLESQATTLDTQDSTYATPTKRTPARKRRTPKKKLWRAEDDSEAATTGAATTSAALSTTSATQGEAVHRRSSLSLSTLGSGAAGVSSGGGAGASVGAGAHAVTSLFQTGSGRTVEISSERTFR